MISPSVLILEPNRFLGGISGHFQVEIPHSKDNLELIICPGQGFIYVVKNRVSNSTSELFNRSIYVFFSVAEEKKSFVFTIKENKKVLYLKILLKFC